MRLALAFITCCTTGCASVIYSPLPPAVVIGKHDKASAPFDIAALKPAWRQRIETIKASGRLPIIDIESTFNTRAIDARA